MNKQAKSSIDTLKRFFLVCDITGEKLRVTDIESGPHNHVPPYWVLYTKGKTTAWKHTIYTIEM